MKLKVTGILMVIAMLLMALPAGAATGAGEDVGVFFGEALVGKQGTCNNLGGLHDVTGGGIGAPLLNGPKNAVYSINAPASVISPLYGEGSLRLCGRLTAPLHEAAGTGTPDTKILGASCVSTKGWDGQGRAEFPSTGRVVYLSNLGWKATVGGTFLVTADIGGDKGKKQDLLVAAVQALSNGAVLGCLAKLQQAPPIGSDDKDSMSPDPFTVAAAYTIIPDAGCDETNCDKKDDHKTRK